MRSTTKVICAVAISFSESNWFTTVRDGNSCTFKVEVIESEIMCGCVQPLPTLVSNRAAEMTHTDMIWPVALLSVS